MGSDFIHTLCPSDGIFRISFAQIGVDLKCVCKQIWALLENLAIVIGTEHKIQLTWWVYSYDTE